jgi:uncharacterized membrane protein
MEGFMKKIVISLVIFILFLLSTSIVYGTDTVAAPEAQTLATPVQEKVRVKAKVIEAGESYEKVEAEDVKRVVQDVRIEILEGDFKGEQINSEYSLTYDMDNKILGYELSVGNRVITEITYASGEVQSIVVQDIVRQNYVIYAVLIFFALILLIGKKQGVKAILGLVITIGVVYLILVKGIYAGQNIISITMISSVLIIILTFIIIAGINKKSFTAMIGTAGGVLSAGLLSMLFGYIAKLSGANEEALMLVSSAQNMIFNFKDLLFAGIVIAALGACMDVGMSIASALAEVKDKKPDITWKELLKSGMNIGGDVIGTMSNTLILAYVGSSMTLILVFMSTNMSIMEILNKESIVMEIVSALCGSMGILFTVPITSFVYAILNKDKVKYKQKPDTSLEGKRSLKL